MAGPMENTMKKTMLRLLFAMVLLVGVGATPVLAVGGYPPPLCNPNGKVACK